MQQLSRQVPTSLLLVLLLGRISAIRSLSYVPVSCPGGTKTVNTPVAGGKRKIPTKCNEYLSLVSGTERWNSSVCVKWCFQVQTCKFSIRIYGREGAIIVLSLSGKENVFISRQKETFIRNNAVVPTYVQMYAIHL